MNMSAKPWSKAQAANNKKFKAKLDRLTNYLVEGDWHSSYNSATYADGDTVTSFFKGKDILPLETLSFSLLQDGSLELRRQYVDGDGSIETEDYVVGIQPFQNSFYVLGLDDNDVGFGEISRRSGVLSLTITEQAEAGDEGFIGITEYTNLSGF